VAVPLVVCAVLIPFRLSLENTNAALVLVLVVVALASTGVRPAGVVAALSSALWFDFFLTEPYQRFNITDRADIETTVLLVLVGLAVTELALWGQRQQARSSRREGYLAGVLTAAGTAAVGGTSPESLIEFVGKQLTDVLNVDACRFSYRTGLGNPRLNHDGSVTRGGRTIDIDRDGLPVDDEIELLVQSGGSFRGRYLLTASARIDKPDLEKRKVAVALADQVGAALAAQVGDR
jgi:hypothetical protein